MTKSNPLNAARKLRSQSNLIGEVLVETFHLLGLFAIGMATVWAAGFAFLEMMYKGHASIEDLLLLFIYLEIGAMVGIYFKTNRLPVRFLIYVAVTALTRHMISYINVSHGTLAEGDAEMNVLIMACAILILATALLLLRYGSNAFPSNEPIADSTKAIKPDV